jgi:uncharacterized protein YbbK (DUF523 family)/uncharacterized protein YbgA (DUF1722 family)
VRYDGGHKRDAFLADALGPLVTWVAVCPEVEIGLGTPREPIRLVGGGPGAPRLVAEASGADLTQRMERFARAKARELAALGLDGYVFKRASPSCGLFDVPVHGENGERPRGGRGVYAAALARRLPMLPMEEEGRLLDTALRAGFLERVFTAARWRAFVARPPSPRTLAAFHAAHRPALRAHSVSHEAALGRMAARAAGAITPRRLGAYGRLLMEAFARPTAGARAADLRREVAGAVKDLDGEARAQAESMLEHYRALSALDDR